MTKTDEGTLRLSATRCPKRSGGAISILCCRGCDRFIRQTADGVICKEEKK